MATYAEVMDHNARNRKAGKMKPVLDHLRVRETENDGHMVEHHYTNPRTGDPSFLGDNEPKVHAFSHDQRKAMVPEGSVLHHIAKHMNVPHEVTNAERGMEEAEGE